MTGPCIKILPARQRDLEAAVARQVTVLEDAEPHLVFGGMQRRGASGRPVRFCAVFSLRRLVPRLGTF